MLYSRNKCLHGNGMHHFFAWQRNFFLEQVIPPFLPFSKRCHSLCCFDNVNFDISIINVIPTEYITTTLSFLPAWAEKIGFFTLLVDVFNRYVIKDKRESAWPIIAGIHLLCNEKPAFAHNLKRQLITGALKHNRNGTSRCCCESEAGRPDRWHQCRTPGATRLRQRHPG